MQHHINHRMCIHAYILTGCKRSIRRQNISLHADPLARQKQGCGRSLPLNMTLLVRVVCKHKVDIQIARGGDGALRRRLVMRENLRRDREAQGLMAAAAVYSRSSRIRSSSMMIISSSLKQKHTGTLLPMKISADSRATPWLTPVITLFTNVQFAKAIP